MYLLYRVAYDSKFRLAVLSHIRKTRLREYTVDI